MFVTGLVLAAGGSSRLGRPKQLLPFGSGTLLGHVLDVARACPFDQTLCVVGGGGGRSGLDAVGFEGVDVIENPVFGEGCSSSIAAALGAVSPECSVLVLMLGDQPGVTSSAVTALLAGRGRRGAGGLSLRRRTRASVRVRAVGVRGSGDASRRQGVWKLLDRAGSSVVEVPVPGCVPPDVDTWEDYERVLAASGAG